MYSAFRRACERLLRIPHDPRAPSEDEASVRVFHAAPGYYKYRLVVWSIRTAFTLFFALLFFGGFSLALMSDRSLPGFVHTLVLLGTAVVFLLMLLQAFFSLAVLRLDYEKRWYVVTDRSLRVREGVMNVREMTVTFANIQNVSVMQGPIQRMLGLADLQVETAGGGVSHANEKQIGHNLHVAWFRGIDNAEEVKALIQDRLRKLKDTGLGDHDDVHHHHGEPPALAQAAAAADVLEALRAVHTEARALREAAAVRR